MNNVRSITPSRAVIILLMVLFIGTQLRVGETARANTPAPYGRCG
jgi:hypothetical protein